MRRRKRGRAIGGILTLGGLAALAVLFGTAPTQWPTLLAQSRPEDVPAAVQMAAEPSLGPVVEPTPIPAVAYAPPSEEASIAAAAPAAGPVPGPAVVNYIVRPGDTLLALADDFDTTTALLLQFNPSLDPAKLRAGQLIKVPDNLAKQGVERPQFVWPADGPITTPFGVPGSAWIGGFHMGLDIGAATGDFVWAAGGGVIASTAKDGMGRGYGTYVLIYHGNGWSTMYAHLSKVYRPAGYVLRQGEPFAEVGMTGFADGPHLHFEVWHDGERLDPIQFLP